MSAELQSHRTTGQARRSEGGTRRPGASLEAQRSPSSGFSLRTRLAVMMALFALVPSLAITYLASKRIASSLELMKSPGVASTLEGALNVGKTSLGRLEAALDGQSRAARGELERGVYPWRTSPQASLDSLRAAHSVDYAGLFTIGPQGGWALSAHSFAPEIPRGKGVSGGASLDSSDGDPGPSEPGRPVQPELPRPLAPGVYYDWNGWLLELIEVRGAAGPQALLVLGYHLGPKFFARVEGLGRGLRFYRQLDVLKRVYVGGIWLWAAATLLAVGVATLVVARAVARGLSRPLVELARAMEQVASGREGVVVGPKGSRETKFLAHTFNRMVDELAAYKRDLARAERAAAWQQVARVIAHEIRNPLTPIQFAIRRIKDRLKTLPEGDRGAVSESLDSIMGEVETLKTLASSFSQFAKLPEPSPSLQDLNKIVAEVVELFGKEGRAEFEVGLADDLPPAFLDGSQVRMILNNLLKNAVEAMPDGGKVAVSTRAEPRHAPRWVVIEVADTGAGMDSQTLSRATDAYFSTKPKGSGLGLAVVQRIVQQHGGALEISSSPGEGTVVTVRFPLSRAARG